MVGKSGVWIGLLVGALLCSPASAAVTFSFGDDRGDYANDGECDDPRFAGSGMTETTLLADDVLHDASDCRAAFNAGNISLRGVAPDGAINFGNDSGMYSKDGECDDMRFKGSGMTSTPLLQSDIMRDATDCAAAFQAGRLELRLR